MIDPEERVADVPIREFLAAALRATDRSITAAMALSMADESIRWVNAALEVEARENLAGPAPF